MLIHQFVHTLNYGDAISGEAIALKRLLRAKGIGGEIYSVHRHEKVAGETRSHLHFQNDLQAQRAAGEQVAVVLHYSIASPLNQLLRSTEGVQKVLVYHNLTPVHWFTGYNERVAKDLVRGREELPGILAEMDLVLADSSYNKEELVRHGFSGALVVPLPLDTDKWSIAANAGIAGVLRAKGERNVLHVGRLAPNKCIEDIIKAFYFYHHKIEEKSRLWLIGSDIDTEIYSFELRRLVSELRLKEAVTFVGAVSDCELRAFYENSDLYLCMSEHEGFCVPLLEAMHFGLPVVAYDACAVGETLADGGVLIKRKGHAEVAELMHLVMTDTALRSSIVERGKNRAAAFGEQAFLTAVEASLLEPLRRGEARSRDALRAM